MTTSTYSLNNFKQLIELNGETVNFELEFTVTSHDNQPFEALVVTQEMLDSEVPLEYQNAQGTISGRIKSNDNKYHSYLLLLKSQTTNVCDVTINIREIAPENIQQPQNQDIRNNGRPSRPILKTQTEQSFWTLKNILLYGSLLIVCIIGGYFLYKALTKPSSKPKIIENDIVLPKIEQSNEINMKLLKDDLKHELHEQFDGLSSKLSDKISSNFENNLNKLSDGLDHKVTDGLNKLSNGLSEDLSNKLSNEISSRLTNGLGSTISDGLGSISNGIEGMTSKIGEDLSSKLGERVTGLGETLSLKMSSTDDGIKETLNSIKSQLENNKNSNEISTDGVLEKLKSMNKKTMKT